MIDPQDGVIGPQQVAPTDARKPWTPPKLVRLDVDGSNKGNSNAEGTTTTPEGLKLTFGRS